MYELCGVRHPNCTTTLGGAMVLGRQARLLSSGLRPWADTRQAWLDSCGPLRRLS